MDRKECHRPEAAYRYLAIRILMPPVARKDKGELGMNWRRSWEGFLEEVASKQRSGPGGGGGEQENAHAEA